MIIVAEFPSPPASLGPRIMGIRLKGRPPEEQEEGRRMLERRKTRKKDEEGCRRGGGGGTKKEGEEQEGHGWKKRKREFKGIWMKVKEEKGVRGREG